MALEDDLRITIKEARAFYKGKAEAASTFLANWKALRENTLLPTLRRATVVFKELGWNSEHEASNGSAALRLGEMPAGGMKAAWPYQLSFNPDSASQKVEIHTVHGDIDRKMLDELKPTVIDQIITRFAKLAEEDDQEKKLPR